MNGLFEFAEAHSSFKTLLFCLFFLYILAVENR